MNPPESLCILRLSALGDVTHVLPVVHTVQKHWPETRIIWIIGRFAHKLVGDIPGVEFVVFDKGKGLSAYGEVKKRLAGRRFDLFLCMQVALRANLIIPFVSAKRKIGFDRERSKDGHGLFVDERIPRGSGQHVVDAFFQFSRDGRSAGEAIGLVAPHSGERGDICRTARRFGGPVCNHQSLRQSSIEKTGGRNITDRRPTTFKRRVCGSFCAEDRVRRRPPWGAGSKRVWKPSPSI